MDKIFQPGAKVLAPLVGGSDLSFRLLARKYGANVTYTEMCIAEYYLKRDDKALKYKNYVFEFDPSDRPLILQLAGNEPKYIIELANHPMFEGKIDAVDLNCGCPQGFAMEKGYGSGLLRDPNHLVSLCQEIAANIKYPLSVKLRLHESTEYTIDLMKRLRQVGVSAFAVHARYAWQKGDKRGLADWNAMKKIRDTFPDIPIIGNGNIGEYSDFDLMIKETGVTGGMAGYGALVKPSIFSPVDVPISQRIQDYLDIAMYRINEWIDIQRHIQWMIKNYNITPLQKAQLFETRDVTQLKTFLESLNPPILIHVDKYLTDNNNNNLDYSVKPKPLTDKEKQKLEKRRQKLEMKAFKKEQKEKGTTAEEDFTNDLDKN